jgi:hypothetical protein
MAAPDLNSFADVLGIAHPWQVTDVQIAQPTRTVVVRVEHAPERASGLFSRRAPAPIRRQWRWEHVPMAGQRCQLVLGLRDGERMPATAWTGDAPTGFTRGLQRLIMDLMLAGATLDQLCVLLRLPIGDLWRHKYKLDQGATGAAPVAPVAAPGVAAPAAPASTVAAAAASAAVLLAPADPAGGLPPEDAPVWTELLLGRAPLEVRTLSLRLLLAKLQREAKLHDDVDLHEQAAGDLYRYFAKNRATLAHEVAQLNLLHSPARQADLRAPAGVPAAAARHAGPPSEMPSELPFELPDASDPLWLDLLQGQVQLDVRTLGLKLLLAKLRNQINVIQDEDMRMVKLVELHRYFLRHQSSLGHEIHQLQRLRAN